MRVADGLYILGCLDRRVTLHSQQIRALNLVYSLRQVGIVAPGSQILVVGGGVAGLTAAAGAARLGMRVTLLEREDELLHLQRNNTKRWIHPHIYDWPAPGATAPDATVPILRWRAASAGDVVQQILSGFNALPENERKLIDVHLGAEVADLGSGPERRVAWHAKGVYDARVSAVILAVGFGLEREVEGVEVLSYWRDDSLDQAPLKGRGRTLISGTGDGGLVDALRASVRDFRHDAMIDDLVGDRDLEPVKERLLAIEDTALVQERKKRGSGSELLHDAYKQLSEDYANVLSKTVDAKLRRLLRKDVTVVLNGRDPTAFSLGASILSRFLISRLHFAFGVRYHPGEPAIKKVSSTYEVRFKVGKPQIFDRVICRHGPDGALEHDFPEVWRGCADRLKDLASLDQTRRPTYGDTFDQPRSGVSDDERPSTELEAEIPTIGQVRRGPTSTPADRAPAAPTGGRGSSVFLYRSRADEFARTVKDEQLTHRLLKAFKEIFGHNPSSSEVEAWRSSLAAMAEVFECDVLQEAYVFVEFKMPMSSSRCDLIVVGNDADGIPHAVVIELKQWSKVTSSDVRNMVMSHGRRRVHPSVQVRGYCQYLRYYHQAFTEYDVKIDGCSFLHDMQDPSSIILLRSPHPFQDLSKDYPVFVHGDMEQLQQFLSERVGHGGGDRISELLSEGSVRPATELLNYVNQAIQSRFEWMLLDEQREAFDLITSKVEASRGTDSRSVVIVRGGPGTGKSVLAIQLLAYGAQHHWRVAHTTGSKAFRTVLQAATQDSADQILMKIHSTKMRGKLPVKELFTLSQEIARIGSKRKDVFELVVYDEAHRLWDYRRRIFQNMNKKLSDVPMIEELINSTKVVAFFLDQNQTVRPYEIGSVEYILEHSFRLGANVEIVDLNTQFRCAGSAAYIEWVEHVLGFEGSSSTVWRDVDGYRFDICESMQQLQRKLDGRRAIGYTCRLVAGFCWPWSKLQPGEPLPHDVRDDRFGTWSAPWIEKSEQDAEPSEHRYTKWAQDPSYYSQVGSIYSAQGFEFDYVGLIFGEDLLYRNGRWEACLEHSHDQQLKLDLKKTGEDPTARIRNIYRVLLTRGMRGTFVFFLDHQTRERFKLLLAG